MLGLNCLIKDTRAVEDIKNAISIMVADRASNDKPTQFPAIYKELRDSGLEIDAESAGALYNELYGAYDDAAISSQEEIEEFVGKDIKDLQESIADAMQGNDNGVLESKIGKLPPEKQVAQMIGSMFRQSEFEGDKRQNSVMREMENLVSKAARSLLPKKNQSGKKSVTETLDNFFSIEQEKFRTLSGGMNTLKTLHDAVKRETKAYADQIADKLSDEDAELFRQKWEAYTNGFINSTYDIMLGKSDQNKLLNEALKQIEIEGVRVVDINGNIKWSILLESGGPDQITKSIKKLFSEGVKDETGSIHKYTREQSERIGDYLARLYKDKLASVKQTKLANNRGSRLSAKNVISDFIKDRGFINLIKDKNGNLLLTQTNWDEALSFIKNKVGDKSGTDIIYEKLNEYLNGLKDADESKKLTDKQIEIITEEFKSTLAAKLVPGTATPHAMERLIALKNLNAGKAFNNETASALNNVIGVSGIDQKVIDQIKDLVQAADDIMKGNKVDSSTSSDPFKNRGAYAYQALSQIERRIKEIVRENKISKSQTQKIVKYIGDNLGAASSTLLLNPNNILENIFTGLASNVGETITLAFTNPRLLKKVGESQKDFWAAFASHVSGGVANEVINETDMSSDLQSGERLRLRGLYNELRKGKTSALGAILKTPFYAVNIATRTVMNSFDAGFNSALLRKKSIGSVYNALKSQGFSGKEVLELMDSALNVDDVTNKELDIQNEAIAKIMRSVGLSPTAADLAQNKRDMKLALYENALLKGAQTQGINITDKQVLEATKALVESAALQAKVIGGKKQIPITGADFINISIYGLSTGLLTPQRLWFKAQKKREEQGKLKRAALNQFGAEVWKNTFGRFAGGIANFLALAVTATPYGFVTAASLSSQKKSILSDDPDAADIYKASPENIRKYTEYHNLVRSMVTRATFGTITMTAVLLDWLSHDDDDDDESIIGNLMLTKSGRRFLQKTMPLSFNITAMFLYEIDDPKLDTKVERFIDIMSNTTGQQYDSWDSLRTAISRAKDDEDVRKAIASFLGGSAPTMNVNQAEQIHRFWNVIQSALNRDKIEDVEADEEIARNIYRETETWIDAFLVNGVIDAFRRAFDEDRKVNRYSEPD